MKRPATACRLMMLSVALLAAAPWTPPAFGQQPASTFAEIDAWQRAKVSIDPADVRAYLSKYPNGEFAELAREQLKLLTGSSSISPPPAPTAPPPAAAPPPPPPTTGRPPAVPAAPQPASTIPPGPPTAVVELTPAAITEIQQLLFERGWRIRKVDGKSVDELRATVSRLQAAWKVPSTGDLTHAQLANLRRIIIPPQWSAIAYSPQGASTSALSRPSRASAEDEAAKSCKKRTGADCNVVSVHSKLCISFSYAVGVANRVRYHSTATASGDSIELAKEASQRECKGLSRFPETCKVQRVVCPDGTGEEPAATKGGRKG